MNDLPMTEMTSTEEMNPESKQPEPGAAARELVDLMQRLPKPRGRKTDVSLHVKAHLYGRSRRGR